MAEPNPGSEAVRRNSEETPNDSLVLRDFDEFDEASTEMAPPVPAVMPQLTLVDKLSQKSHMRLLVGIPIVWTILATYLGVAVSIMAGWITAQEAKEVVALLAVPSTLAATVVGFFFGRNSEGKN